jgi:hypothetical protein
VTRRTPEERRRDRAAGVDRFGRPLPRSLGTNPRARTPSPATVARPGSTPPARVSREQARTVHCPACGALAGEHCVRRNGAPRAQAHALRHEVAVRALAGPSRSADHLSPAISPDAAAERASASEDAPAHCPPRLNAAPTAPAQPAQRASDTARSPSAAPRAATGLELPGAGSGAKPLAALGADPDPAGGPGA